MAETIRAGAGSNRVVAKSAEMQQTQAMHAVILGPIPPSDQTRPSRALSARTWASSFLHRMLTADLHRWIDGLCLPLSKPGMHSICRRLGGSSKSLLVALLFSSLMSR